MGRWVAGDGDGCGPAGGPAPPGPQGGRDDETCGGRPPHPPLRGGARPRTPQHRHGAAAQGGAGRQDGLGTSRGKARMEVYGAMGKAGRWGQLRDWVSSGSGTQSLLQGDSPPT